MYRALTILFFFLFAGSLAAQEAIDPAFDAPFPAGSHGRGIRWNGAIGMVIIDGKMYQQFSLRPDIPFGKWGVGLDLTLRIDEDGKIKEDEWDDGFDFVEKIYYVRYGEPGDPLYIRLGGLDNVTLGYGIIMKRYSNTIQYPSIKRIGGYVEGEQGKVSWQGMFNNMREFEEPGLMGARVGYNIGPKGLTIGATLVHDGNQFAGLIDNDDDDIPDQLDQFPGMNDYHEREFLFSTLSTLTPGEIQSLIDRGYIPDIYREPRSYDDIQESVTFLGADVGFPLLKGRPVSLWGYGQMAKVVDFGWGWAFPGARMVAGPLEIGAEFRHYEKEFIGDFFNFSYEIERAQLGSDTLFHTKESRLAGLGTADGYYADILYSFANLGYIYSWYLNMDGPDYPEGKTIYGEAGVMPPMVARLKKAIGYYFQPNVGTLFHTNTDGLIYGGKLYFAMAENVNLVYDHRISYSNGVRSQTVRIETMITF
jgi:hypothetical protein